MFALFTTTLFIIFIFINFIHSALSLSRYNFHDMYLHRTVVPSVKTNIYGSRHVVIHFIKIQLLTAPSCFLSYCNVCCWLHLPLTSFFVLRAASPVSSGLISHRANGPREYRDDFRRRKPNYQCEFAAVGLGATMNHNGCNPEHRVMREHVIVSGASLA